MDLIYADDSFRDIGVLQHCTMDLAYGLDENDFEIVKPLAKPECAAGWYVYVDGTEYGGVIDAIGANNINDELTYYGRTWHGILASKVIEPDAGEGYYIPTGEANSVVAEIIDRCDLGEIFSVSTDDSGIYIDEPFPLDTTPGFRYQDVNYGLFEMLFQNDAKLKIVAGNGTVKLSVEPLMNYAALEELDSSQIQFDLMQTYTRCNHLVCLGQGELQNRYVIHLFTDENGDLQPYTTVDAPIKDSEYILTKQNQLLFGKDEYAEVYDYRDAAITENYEVLTVEPDDWVTDYDKYYEKSGDDEDEQEPSEEEAEGEDSYSQVERNIQDVYTLLDTKPEDWKPNADKYFTLDGDEYKNVVVDYRYDTVTPAQSTWKKNYSKYYYKDGNSYKKIGKVAKYTLITKKPKGWTKKYNTYYITDGIGNYHTVSGEIKYRYKRQTQKPSEWNDDEWKNAYIKRMVNGKAKYIQIRDDETLSRRTTAPKWKKNTYYSKVSHTVPPAFDPDVDYYSKKMVIPSYNRYATKYKRIVVPPTFVADTYYRLDKDVDVGVEFVVGAYFKLVLDHYAELVAGGIDRLKEINQDDTMTFDVKDEGIQYDIGDMVGGVEEITGTTTTQPITKKIVKIDEYGILTITHEVNGYGS